MTDHVCGLMGFGRGLDGIHDTCPACDEREARYRATRALMPDDSLKHYGLHDGPTNRLPSPRGQTHYEGCERTAVDALDRAREDAERWRALMTCARLRVMGGAAWGTPEQHIGLEVWETYPGVTPDHSENSRAELTRFVDACRARAAARAQP